MDVTSEERWAERRAQYIASNSELRKVEAKAKAWAELGYTASGISKQIDRGESTVRSYFDTIARTLGNKALLTKNPDELDIDAALEHDT